MFVSDLSERIVLPLFLVLFFLLFLFDGHAAPSVPQSPSAAATASAPASLRREHQATRHICLFPRTCRPGPHRPPAASRPLFRRPPHRPRRPVAVRRFRHCPQPRTPTPPSGPSFPFSLVNLLNGRVLVYGRAVGERGSGRAAGGHAGGGGAGAQAAAARNGRMVGIACAGTRAHRRPANTGAATEVHDELALAHRCRCALCRCPSVRLCAAARAPSSSRCRFCLARVSMRGRFRPLERSFTQTFSTPFR